MSATTPLYDEDFQECRAAWSVNLTRFGHVTRTGQSVETAHRASRTAPRVLRGLRRALEGNPSRRLRIGQRIASSRSRGTKENAFDKSCDCVDRGRRGVVPGQQVYPHGRQHQDDSERRGCGCSLCLAVASRRIVGECIQLPAYAMIVASRATSARHHQNGSELSKRVAWTGRTY